MGRALSGECHECGAEFTHGNPDWLTGITGLDREELHYCEKHLGEAIDGVTIDLSIGSAHTRSEEFEADRERRQNEEEIREAKTAYAVRFARILQTQDGAAVALKMPSEAKHELKELGKQATGRRYLEERDVWVVDQHAAPDAADHLKKRGWDVEVAPEVQPVFDA
jgi:hypothetical protein